MSHLVVAVHEPAELDGVGILGGCHHLAARPVHGAHDLPRARRLGELHAAAAHHEGLALVALLGDVDEVPGGDHPATTVSRDLPSTLS